MAVAKGDYIVEVKIIDGEVKAKIQGLTKGFVKLDTAASKLKSALGGANDGLGNTVSNAGLAGATLTELTRTISDMPFGITAITNNLSQLATLFITLQSKTKETAYGLGTFGGTIKGLIKQLKGPLGVVLAFQLVITSLDFFAKSSRKAKKEADALTKSIESQAKSAGDTITELNTLLGVIQDSASSTFDFDRAVKQLKDKFPVLNSQLEIANISIEDLSNNTEEAKEITDQYTDSIIRQAKARAVLSELERVEGEIISAQLKESVEIAKLEEERQERLSTSLSERNIRVTKTGKLVGETNEFINSEIDKSIQAVKDSTEETVKELNIAKGALTEFLDPSEILDPLSTKTVSAIKRVGYSVKTLFDMEIETDGILTTKVVTNSAKRALTREEELQKLKEIAGQLLSFGIESSNAQFEADVSIEEKRTVLANNKLKERLNNEKLSAKEREKINNQIASNEQNLQNKRDKLAERQFKQQKAISIIQTLMSTYEMATDAFGTIKGMKFLGPLALPLAIAAATTATTFGLSQVAAIRRQQFVPSAIGSGGGVDAGGAGAPSVQAPNFNVVGSTAQSQLAETIAGAEARPTRAYVVGKDVTTQQELDRNRRRTSALG